MLLVEKTGHRGEIIVLMGKLGLRGEQLFSDKNICINGGISN